MIAAPSASLASGRYKAISSSRVAGDMPRPRQSLVSPCASRCHCGTKFPKERIAELTLSRQSRTTHRVLAGRNVAIKCGSWSSSHKALITNTGAGLANANWRITAGLRIS
ncbi:hypothetical protein [Thiobacillus sp.]|uniref:hypothetical protein n=1 Tax=Thiobacillus sp. TaxID=924 RepID=UPI0025EBE4BE|nr:hypothetical protein [Thiobacillus sp.]